MKLICSLTSPYSRKVRILIREKGLEVEEITTVPFEDDSVLHDANPLGKVPALVLDDGTTLYDSPVICEYLDALDQPWLATGTNEWQQKTQHALGDGITDAVLTFRMERIRPRENWWDFWAERQQHAVARALFHLEKIVDELGDPWNYGNLGVVCGLGYMDFRAAEMNWRDHAPKLAKWFETFEKRTAYMDTAPPE